jgi:hypothetical protein
VEDTHFVLRHVFFILDKFLNVLFEREMWFSQQLEWRRQWRISKERRERRKLLTEAKQKKAAKAGTEAAAKGEGASAASADEEKKKEQQSKDEEKAEDKENEAGEESDSESEGEDDAGKQEKEEAEIEAEIDEEERRLDEQFERFDAEVEAQSEAKSEAKKRREGETMLKAFTSTINVMQLLTQRMWIGDSQLLQLPNLIKEDIKLLARNKITRLAHFLERTPEALKGYSKEELAHMRQVAASLPVLDVKVKFEIENEEDQNFYQGDHVTVTVSLHRKDLGRASAAAAAEDSSEGAQRETTVARGEGSDLSAGDDPERLSWNKFKSERAFFKDKSKSCAAFAPDLPFIKNEVWYVILFDVIDRRVLQIERAMELRETQDVTLRLRLPEDSGDTRRYRVFVKSDSYVHADVEIPFSVSSRAALRGCVCFPLSRRLLLFILCACVR